MKQFQSFCAKCFDLIVHNDDGNIVLSCGDFICGRCSYTAFGNQNIPGSVSVACPACNKQKLRILSLNDGNLPEEVKMSMTDFNAQLETIKTGYIFQIRHYIKIINMLRDQLVKSNIKSTRMISSTEKGADENQSVQLLDESRNPKERQSQLMSYQDNKSNDQSRERVIPNSIDSNQNHSFRSEQLTRIRERDTITESRPSSAMNPPLSVWNDPSLQSAHLNATNFRPQSSPHFMASANNSLKRSPPESFNTSAITPNYTRPMSSNQRPCTNPSPSRLRSPHLPIMINQPRAPLVNRNSFSQNSLNK